MSTVDIEVRTRHLAARVDAGAIVLIGGIRDIEGRERAAAVYENVST